MNAPPDEAKQAALLEKVRVAVGWPTPPRAVILIAVPAEAGQTPRVAFAGTGDELLQCVAALVMAMTRATPARLREALLEHLFDATLHAWAAAQEPAATPVQ